MRAEGEVLAPTAAALDGAGWWYKVWRAGAISVLVVSESPAWSEELAALLAGEGYAVRLDERGDAAAEPSCPFDLAIVDLAITGRSPAAVFAVIRARSSMPILAVSPEVHGEPALLAAYAAGADQLVIRSLRSRELVARVRALLRRSPPRRRTMWLDGDATRGIELDVASSTVAVAGHTLSLSQRESAILHALLTRPGRVVTRRELIGPLGGEQADRGLDAQVRSVRTKLEAAEGHRRIVAVRGVGFRLLPDADLVPDDAAS